MSLLGSCHRVLGVILVYPNWGHMHIPEPVAMPRSWNSLNGPGYFFHWEPGMEQSKEGWNCKQTVEGHVGQVGSCRWKTAQPSFGTSPRVFMLWVGCSSGGYFSVPPAYLCLCFFFYVPVFHPSHLNPPVSFGLFHASLDWGCLPAIWTLESSPEVLWSGFLLSLICYNIEERHLLGTLDSFQKNKLCSSWNKCAKFTSQGIFGGFWWIVGKITLIKKWKRS